MPRKTVKDVAAAYSAEVLSLRLAMDADPRVIMAQLGLDPDPWQVKLLSSTAQEILLLCSRQAGKSTTTAVLALATALFHPGSLILLLSPSLRQSQELFRKVTKYYRHLNRPIPSSAETSLELELTTGSRIVSLPSSEETIRGYSAVRLLVVDEASRVPDELYRSIRPMLAVSKGRIVALTTPFGKRGWFYEEWQGEGSWERYRVQAGDVPRIGADFLANERRRLGDLWYRQEYECDFTLMAGLVYPELAGCVVDPVPLSDIRVARSYAGCDFGFHNPSAVVFGLLDEDDVLWIVDEVYGSRMTDDDLALRVKPRVKDLATEAIWCDSEAPGSIEKFRRNDLPARKAMKKIDLGIRAVTARIRTGRLKVFRNCVNVIKESELYRYYAEDEKRLLTDNPVKEFDHALDACRYLITGMDRVSTAFDPKGPEKHVEPYRVGSESSEEATPAPHPQAGRYRKIDLKGEDDRDDREHRDAAGWDSW